MSSFEQINSGYTDADSTYLHDAEYVPLEDMFDRQQHSREHRAVHTAEARRQLRRAGKIVNKFVRGDGRAIGDTVAIDPIWAPDSIWPETIAVAQDRLHSSHGLITEIQHVDTNDYDSLQNGIKPPRRVLRLVDITDRANDTAPRHRS